MHRCESADEPGNPRALHLEKGDDLLVLVTRMQGDGGNGGRAMARPDEEQTELEKRQVVRKKCLIPTARAYLTTTMYIRKIPRLQEPRITLGSRRFVEVCV